MSVLIIPRAHKVWAGARAERMRAEIARELDGQGIELELSAGYPLGKAVLNAEPEDFWIGFRQPGFGDLWIHQGMFVLFLEALRSRRRHSPGEQLCIRDLIEMGNQIDAPDGNAVNDYEIPPELDMTPEQFAIFMNEIKVVGQIKTTVEQVAGQLRDVTGKIEKLPDDNRVKVLFQEQIVGAKLVTEDKATLLAKSAVSGSWKYAIATIFATVTAVFAIYKLLGH